MTLFSVRNVNILLFIKHLNKMPFFSVYPFPIYYFIVPSHYRWVQGSLGKTGMVDGKKRKKVLWFLGRIFWSSYLDKLGRQGDIGVVSAWVCVQTTSGLFNSFNLVLLWIFQFCYAYCNKCTHKISSFSPSLSLSS